MQLSFDHFGSPSFFDTFEVKALSKETIKDIGSLQDIKSHIRAAIDESRASMDTSNLFLELIMKNIDPADRQSMLKMDKYLNSKRMVFVHKETKETIFHQDIEARLLEAKKQGVTVNKKVVEKDAATGTKIEVERGEIEEIVQHDAGVYDRILTAFSSAIAPPVEQIRQETKSATGESYHKRAEASASYQEIKTDRKRQRGEELRDTDTKKVKGNDDAKKAEAKFIDQENKREKRLKEAAKKEHTRKVTEEARDIRKKVQEK